jgi:hypothetical protein
MDRDLLWADLDLECHEALSYFLGAGIRAPSPVACATSIASSAAQMGPGGRAARCTSEMGLDRVKTILRVIWPLD